MKQFNLEDADGITSYIESLDEWNQFEEINVNLITKEYDFDKRAVAVQISIKALGNTIYDSNFNREFIETVFKFDKYFEEEIRRLSASALVVSKLFDLEESLNKYKIDNQDTYSLVTIDGNDKSYELKVIEHENKNPLVKIRTSFVTQSNLTQSNHRLETKEFIAIDQIEQAIKELINLKSYL